MYFVLGLIFGHLNNSMHLVQCSLGLITSLGITVALQMVQASLLPGKYSEHYQQFDTIKNLRTAYSNYFESSWEDRVDRRVLQGEQGVTLNSSTCETQSLFYEKFTKWLTERMGRLTKSNAGLLHLVLISISNNAKGEEQDFVSTSHGSC